MSLPDYLLNESLRCETFPVCKNEIFMAHAGVTVLPKPVAQAMVDYTLRSSEVQQEFGDVMKQVAQTRKVAGEFVGADPSEIALLGPTSLGLSLFAGGLEWRAGDEVICYHGDYPANVYPWIDLRRKGVVVKYLEPSSPGEITPELVAGALTAKTRLVALASCHFFAGYRIDIDTIGQLVRERGILFSLDGIQTIGAFRTSMKHVDFMSADAHKWMLGPLAMGIVFVRREHFEKLHPILLGASNGKSPNFIALDEIIFPDNASRYEPGVLNIAGMLGMKAALELIAAVGQEQVEQLILGLKQVLVGGLGGLGFEFVGPVEGPNASGITTFRHERVATEAIFRACEREKIVVSWRHGSDGRDWIRVSPHFYNTRAEMDRVVGVIRGAI